MAWSRQSEPWSIPTSSVTSDRCLIWHDCRRTKVNAGREPGTIQLDGDTATGRAYIQELARTRDGRQGLNCAIYHDRYQRTGDGWKFTERVYEGQVPRHQPAGGLGAPACQGCPLTRRPETCLRRKDDAEQLTP